jgi:hypothetical protein
LHPGGSRRGSKLMRIAFTSIIYAIDLGLFVLVFVIIRSRRASPRVIAGIVVLAMVMYLASLALLVFISTHVSLSPTRRFGHMAEHWTPRTLFEGG